MRPLARLLPLASAAVLLSVAFHRLWLHAATNELNQDEFQHGHIAWGVLRGRVPYRDFFEHHGPLSAWLGAAVLRLRGEAAASFETFLVLRRVNLFWLAAETGLVAWMGRRLSRSWGAGLSAASLFAASSLLGFVGVQYRPDGLQNLLMLCAMALVLTGRDRLAGVCLGLMLGLNGKALLPLVGVAAGVVASAFSSRSDRVERDLPATTRFSIWRLGRLASGVVPVVAVLAAALGAQGALVPYIDEAWTGNVALAAGRASTDIAALSRSRVAGEDAALLVVLAMGLAVSLLRAPGSGRRAEFVFVAVVGATLLMVLCLPLRSYAFLMPLPVLCVLAAAGGRPTPTGERWPALPLLVGALVLIVTKEAPTSENPAFAIQRRTLARVLTSSREEPVAYLWPSRCGAYVFNADADYDWLPSAVNLYEAAFPRSGEAFERIVREQVMKGRMRFVVAEPTVVEELPPDVRAYLDSHFQHEDCLLTRRGADK
jgi:hypothetical protein